MEAIVSNPALSSRFELRSGYLTERTDGGEVRDLEVNNRRTARANLLHAGRFLAYLHAIPFQMVAVSGSTSYGSASRSKDLDLFCVAPEGRMWISVAEGLLMARAYGFANRTAPKICLSCVMDQSFALSTFAKRRDPLFARDAIEAKVVRGPETHHLLMKAAGWISKLYPVAYNRTLGPERSSLPGPEPSALDRVMNRFVFETVGRYMRLKASMLNRRLKKRGGGGDLFVMRSGEGHLIYESRRYTDLRHEYDSMLPGVDNLGPEAP